MRRLLQLTVVLSTVVHFSAGPLAAQPTARTHLVVITGVSGEKRFADSFQALSKTLIGTASGRFGIPDAQITYLTENAASAAETAGKSGRSTKENITKTLGAVVAGLRPNDMLAIVIFGHGSSLGGTNKLNVPGPDITDLDFATLLSPVTQNPVVFVNTASASGAWVKALSGRNRVIITATKSGREQNETLFPTFFVQALSSEAGDADKDGRVSMLEAFTFARTEVAKNFEEGNRLPTEHPQLDDNGDGVPTEDPSDKGPDGVRARATYLEPLGGVNLSRDPRAAPLLEKRRAVEAQIDALRAKRATMTEAAYQLQLEPLLVNLAEVSRELRTIQGGKP